MRPSVRQGKLGLVVLLATVYLVGCHPDTVDDDTTNTLLIIRNMFAVTEDGESADLFSDVCFNDGAPPPGCTAINDFAEVLFRAEAKDFGLGAFPAFTYNNIILERYRVTFLRSDGRNVPGVDVPFPFDGVMTLEVPVGADAAHVFTIVRQQAKLEPPLSNLAFNGGAIVISTLAQVDFFGRDVAGRPITVRGFLNVSFGDF